jgi:SRSO17 transposase
VAAGHSVTVDPARWQELFDQVMGRVAGRFARVELRRRTRAFVCGLLSDLPRKNCWTLAEHAGDASLDGRQHLLARAVWDADAVRDDVRAVLIEHLGDPDAVLVVDETGDLKKGRYTVGVQRQYTGTAGKVDNAQVAVYLAYAAEAGHGVIDRELYLPQGWLADPQRCRGAGVPDQVGFATKPELARRMLERALDAGVPAGWVTGDEVYGNSPALRGWLEGRRLPYVLAVKATEPLCGRSGSSVSAARLAEQLPPEGWLRISAGQGAKGRRWYAWSPPPLGSAGAPAGWGRWLLVLRWRSWYRWTTLAMLAHAFLVVAAVIQHARHPPPLGLIPLTCNEIQHLFAALVAVPVADPGHRLRWSWWRRHKHARARACHYRRQAAAWP